MPEILTEMDVLQPPFRLRTAEDIRRAEVQNIAHFTKKQFQALLRFSQKHTLAVPPILELLPEKVPLHLYDLRQTLVTELSFTYSTLAKLDLSDDPTMFDEYLDDMERICRFDNLFSFLGSVASEATDVALNPRFREQLQVELNRKHYYVVSHELCNYLRRLIRNYIKSSRSNGQWVPTIRTLVMAYSMFEVCNDDVLFGLREGFAKGRDSALLQNSVAELLFQRLPLTLRAVILPRDKGPVDKLTHKILKFRLTAYQKSNILSTLNAAKGSRGILVALKNIERAVRAYRIEKDEKVRLLGLINSLRIDVETFDQFYEKVFLNERLIPLRQAYQPQPIQEKMPVFTRRLVRTLCDEVKLNLYPTKDYLDFLKGFISGDCTTGIKLATAHMLNRRFFNVRIFEGANWIGNIYALDFLRERGVIIIDRIQMSRELRAHYHRFFPRLKKALIRLFRKCDYRLVLTPRTISNHDFVRTCYRNYCTEVRMRSIVFERESFEDKYFECFEGKKRGNFFVFIERR